MYRGHTLGRRTFLAASTSLAAGGVFGGAMLDANLPALPQHPELFVLDRRFTAPGSISPHGDVALIDGDVTALWRDRLNVLWRTSTCSVAGVTEPAALFCLEQLARGHGRKVSMRHPIAGTNAVRWVISPVSSRGFS